MNHKKAMPDRAPDGARGTCVARRTPRRPPSRGSAGTAIEINTSRGIKRTENTIPAMAAARGVRSDLRGRSGCSLMASSNIFQIRMRSRWRTFRQVASRPRGAARRSATAALPLPRSPSPRTGTPGVSDADLAPQASRRHLVARAVARIVAKTVLLVALYALAPVAFASVGVSSA